MVISVNRRLFRYFGSYSGISVIPVILVNRRTPHVQQKVIFYMSMSCLSNNKFQIIHLGRIISDIGRVVL